MGLWIGGSSDFKGLLPLWYEAYLRNDDSADIPEVIELLTLCRGGVPTGKSASLVILSDLRSPVGIYTPSVTVLPAEAPVLGSATVFRLGFRSDSFSSDFVGARTAGPAIV